MLNDENATILVVDDKATNIFALEEILSGTGRRFLRASNGQEALKTLLKNEVDLVILDVQMPGMDGFEVAQILKTNKRTSNIPIIFASAEKKESKFVIKGFEEGAIDYLSKPLDPEITKAKVSVLLELHLQKKELIKKNAELEKYSDQIKLLNADLKRSLTQLEATNKELESFSYSISHDLRSPLRAINSYSSIILEDYQSEFDPECKRLFENIRRNANKMSELIDDLLAFSKLGRSTLRKSKIDFNELVRKVVEELKNSMPGSLKAEISIHELKPAEADRALLYQVFMNLISNACKYSAKRPTPQIEISFSENREEYNYSVKDNGSGFDMMYSDKLFGVFQRLHSDDEFEGTGVGLAIVQRIITRHGGRVWAEGEIDKGATFYFSLPKPLTQKK